MNLSGKQDAAYTSRSLDPPQTKDQKLSYNEHVRINSSVTRILTQRGDLDIRADVVKGN